MFRAFESSPSKDRLDEFSDLNPAPLRGAWMNLPAPLDKTILNANTN